MSDVGNVWRLKSLFDDLGDRQLPVAEEFGEADGEHFVITKDADVFSTIATS